MREYTHQTEVLKQSEPALSHCQESDKREKEQHKKMLAQWGNTVMLPLSLLALHSSPSACANGSDKHSKICCERIASMNTHKKRVKMKTKMLKREIVRIESVRSQPLTC